MISRIGEAVSWGGETEEIIASAKKWDANAVGAVKTVQSGSPKKSAGKVRKGRRVRLNLDNVGTRPWLWHMH